MNDTVTFNDQGLESRSLSSYTEQAYLDYSMYVILDRIDAEGKRGKVNVQRFKGLGEMNPTNAK